MRRHFDQLKELFTRPGLFFGEAFLDPDPRGASRFAMRNGLLLAAGLSLVEAVSERSWSWTLVAVTLVLFVALPIGFLAVSALWAFLIGAASTLLGEPIPFRTAYQVTAYSTAGLFPILFGGLLAWLALAVIPLQVLGLQRGLACSRVRSSVLVIFPFTIAAIFLLFFTFMFEVF